MRAAIKRSRFSQSGSAPALAVPGKTSEPWVSFPDDPRRQFIGFGRGKAAVFRESKERGQIMGREQFLPWLDHLAAEGGIVYQGHEASGFLREATGGPILERQGKLSPYGLDFGVMQGPPEGQPRMPCGKGEVMVQSPLQSALVAAAKDLPIGAEFNQDEIRLKGAEVAEGALEAALVTVDTAHQGERQCCCLVFLL